VVKEPEVILVDIKDNQTGTMSKLKAHREARLHRAVSVFIRNSKGEWLLQKRAANKYHSGGLWTNTCCTHPLPGEDNMDSASRRLNEEMGLSCKLNEVFSFIYKEELDNNLTEYEFDHVFTGISDAVPVINPLEVSDWKYIPFDELKKDIESNPSSYTVWFREIYQNVFDHLTGKRI
jgi:isopentenyl-diphosphate delta-isomerase